MNTTPLLKFAQGNGKLPPSTLIFSIPAGHTCPGALICKAMTPRHTGQVIDGDQTTVRCFAASEEAQYTNVRKARWHNLDLLLAAKTTEAMADLIERSLVPHLTKRRRNPANVILRVRIHESGDFFSAAYLAAWILVAQRFPDLIFYAYSKSLQLILDAGVLPANFIITASAGGRFDHLLEHFERRSYIVLSEKAARSAGLPVDHDDTHAHLKPAGAFALLVHNTQPAGSEAAAALSERKRKGEFVGYGKQLACSK